MLAGTAPRVWLVAQCLNRVYGAVTENQATYSTRFLNRLVRDMVLLQNATPQPEATESLVVGLRLGQ